MAVIPDILTETGAIINDTLKDLFFDEPEILFLKASETADEFETVFTLSDSWFFDYDKFRQQFRLEVSRSDDDFNSSVVEATHIQTGDDVYVIANADTLPPKGTSTEWKFYCTRFTHRNQFSNIY